MISFQRQRGCGNRCARRAFRANRGGCTDGANATRCRNTAKSCAEASVAQEPYAKTPLNIAKKVERVRQQMCAPSVSSESRRLHRWSERGPADVVRMSERSEFRKRPGGTERMRMQRPICERRGKYICCHTLSSSRAPRLLRLS